MTTLSIKHRCGHVIFGELNKVGKKAFCPICNAQRPSIEKIIKCDECGAIKTVKAANTKYCSKQCSHNADVANRKIRRYEPTIKPVAKKKVERRWDCEFYNKCLWNEKLNCHGCDDYSPMPLDVLDCVRVGDSMAQTGVGGRCYI